MSSHRTNQPIDAECTCRGRIDGGKYTSNCKAHGHLAEPTQWDSARARARGERERVEILTAQMAAIDVVDSLSAHGKPYGRLEIVTGEPGDCYNRLFFKLNGAQFSMPLDNESSAALIAILRQYIARSDGRLNAISAALDAHSNGYPLVNKHGNWALDLGEE